VYGERYTEECCSEDIGAQVVRIFDVNPTKHWLLEVSNVVLGGHQLLRMPFVKDDRSRSQCIEDGKSPITWFLSKGTVRDQKNVLVYEVLPFLVEQDEIGGQILWCPSSGNAYEADFRQDAQEVLDGFEKLEEFNNRYSMRFSMGLAKMWLPRGEEWDVERVYICRLSAALDMIGYFYSNCRVLSLGNFTTNTDGRKPGKVVDVE